MGRYTIKNVLLILAGVMIFVSSSYGGYNYCGEPATITPTPGTDGKTLKLLQVITRHGDRTTITKLPVDDSVWICNFTTYLAPSLQEEQNTQLERIFRKNYIRDRQLNKGTCYAGELTQLGFNQHIELGQSLRGLYVDNYKYVNGTQQVAIRSTDVPRTLASAQGHFQGLFPPQEGSTTPVQDIFTIETDLDNMTPNTALCPNINKALDKVHAKKEYVDYMKKVQPFYNQLLSLFNMTSSSPAWSDLFDALQVYTCHNLTYPKGFTADMFDQLVEIANWQYAFELSDTEYVRLGVGTFTAELALAMQEVINGEDLIPYLIYSGHDTTLAPLLASLSLYPGQWPPYASHVELELWETSDKEYEVAVKYMGQALNQPYCKGAYLCPFNTFLKGISPYIPDHYASECA